MVRLGPERVAGPDVNRHTNGKARKQHARKHGLKRINTQKKWKKHARTLTLEVRKNLKKNTRTRGRTRKLYERGTAEHVHTKTNTKTTQARASTDELSRARETKTQAARTGWVAADAEPFG